MPVLNHCCCGCSLRTGTLTVGYLGAIFSILGLFASIIITCISADISKSVASQPGMVIEPGLQSGTFTTMEQSGPPSGLITSLAISIVGSVIGIILNILLVVGVNKERTSYLMPWIIVQGLFLVGNIIASLIAAVEAFGVEQIGVTIGVIVIFTSILSALLQVYFILVVYSYYQQLSASQNDGTFLYNLHKNGSAPEMA